MAQETILKVSLKDYKKGIDDLRASLLGLDKDSEEYGKIVQEIAERQDNLNDAMNAGKQAVNAVDGSYNALAQTLSNLKKEWKNMEMGTPEWEAMAVRINDINDQLKDADASVGVFTRNVGDYANAFEEAFKQAAGGLSSMPGIVGSIASTTKQLIPLIQKASTTATAGLNGVKKAIVSTGIGALIVAVGLLIAHFDDIRNLFKKNNPLEDAQKSFDDLKKTIDSTNESLSLQIELMEAEGATTEQVRLKKIELIKAQQAQTQAQLDNVRATIKQIEAHSAFRRWITGEKKELEGLKELEQELFELDTKQSKEITKLLNSNTADSLKKKKQAADEEKKKLDEVLKKVKENSKSEIQTLTDKYKEEKALLEKHHKDTTELDKQYAANVKKIIGQTTDQLYSRLAEFSPFESLGHQYLKATETVMAFQQAVDRKFPPQGLIKTEEVTEKMISNAKDLGLEVGNTAEDFTIAYRLAYQEYKKISEQFTKDTLLQTDAYKSLESQLSKTEEGTYDWYKTNSDMQKEALKNLNKQIEDFETLKSNIEAQIDYAHYNGLNAELAKLQFLLEDAAKSLEEYKAFLPEWTANVEKAENELEEFVDTQKDLAYNSIIAEGNLKRQTDVLKEEYSKLITFNTTSFYDIYQKRLEAAEWYRNNLEIIEGETYEQHRARVLAAEQAITNIKKEYKQKQLEIEKTFVSTYAAFGNSLLDIQENQMKQEMKINENGEQVRKYTDEEIFNTTKDRRISLGWLETIQGSLAAFMGYQEYPQPYGALLGAAAAAATFAAGVAQIEAIKATQFNSAGQNISNPVAVVNATPRMADYQPDTIQNLTGVSETQNLANALQQTPLFVSVTDINAAQVKVTDRNNESSF